MCVNMVPGCKNNSYKPECQEMSFYTLPLDNPDFISEWLIKMHLQSVNEHSRICSVHLMCGKNIPKLFPWNFRRRKSTKLHSSAQPLAPKKLHVTLAEKGKSLHMITVNFLLAHMCLRSSSWLIVSLNC